MDLLINPEIVLIRGLPGSGKSTMAKRMLGYRHLEADMFFEIDGKYVYDASKIREAHDWCVSEANASLKSGQSVVVSNIFAKGWEIERYTSLGFHFRIIEAKGNWPNLHGVSKEKIDLIRSKWETLPDKLTT